MRDEVWKRDGGRCTFTSEHGVRCPETRGLECDHIEPVARGGTSEPSNLRLRCRAHNQLEAERTFGKAFMQNKRDQATAAGNRKRKGNVAEQAAAAPAREFVAMWEICSNDEEIVAWLKNFKYSVEDARWALKEVGPKHGAIPTTRQLSCLYALRDRDKAAVPAMA